MSDIRKYINAHNKENYFLLSGKLDIYLIRFKKKSHQTRFLRGAALTEVTRTTWFLKLPKGVVSYFER